MKKNLPKNTKGFSLVELLVSMFIFVLIILTAVSVFAVMSSQRKKEATIQQHIEDASTAMELMAKTIRMNGAAHVPPGAKKINFYHTQKGECVSYWFDETDADNAKLRKATAVPLMTGDTPPAPDPDSCIEIPAVVSWSEYADMHVDGLVRGKFYRPFLTTETTIGRVTISMNVNKIWMQNTVSFRDYSQL